MHQRLYKRWIDLQEDRKNLPYEKPGGKRKESVRGHQEIIEELFADLDTALREYQENCQPRPDECPNRQRSSDSRFTVDIDPVLAGRIAILTLLIGACMAAPEICIPVGLAGARAVQ